MPVTAAQVQAWVVAKVGDLDPDTLAPTTAGYGLLAEQVALVWAMYADKALIAPRLQALYVERDLLALKADTLGMLVTFSAGGVTFNQSDKAKLLQARYAQVVAEITQAEQAAVAVARAGGAVGTLTQRAPVQPPTPAPATPWEPRSPYADANDPALAGSPYWPRRFGWGRP